ncbi:MAG: hypothetical protein K9J06_16115 [Flavobacteriales bacterium]|nr:hypothetical protein [Flavobacteriales bacterium]
MKTVVTILLMLAAVSCAGQDVDFSGETHQPSPRTKEPEEQAKPRSKFKNNLILGGNFGLQFGTVTFVDISPLAGYQVFKNAFLGLGVTYQYLNWETSGGAYATHTVGGRAFARYVIWKGIMAHAEFEMLNLDCFDEDHYVLTNELKTVRTWVPGALFGAGYYQRAGNRSGFTALVLFNAMQSNCTPYANPVIRIGFNFGI